LARSSRLGRKTQRADPGDGERLTTLRAALEYDGTRFCGFQWQPAVRTVAGELEAALLRLLGEAVKVAAAGRTDTGVHASGQVVSLRTSRSFPFERLALALNAALPQDIAVREAAVVADSFSARFSARERRYVYAILNRPQRSALFAQRAYHVYRPLDVEAMRTAAAPLLGTHDFRSFCATLPESGVTVRTVTELRIEPRGEFLCVHISADGFLHRMVRTIVGTLIECGTGRREPASMAAILQSRDRTTAGLTAPAQGLYLAGVRYDDYDSYRQPLP
jgi:tRNA pseudouridine38-40 synthase